MMDAPQTKTDLIEGLSRVQREVTNTVHNLSESEFSTGTTESWSAAEYLKHLILSVKPLAKAMNLQAAGLQRMFGQPDRPSISYAELVAGYKAKIAEGVRAEDNPPVTPTNYRFPEGTTDEKAHLVQAWNAGNNRLLEAIQGWSEEELDTHQIPHPAIGLLTIREMLYFTLHHNTMHWHDIEQAAKAYSWV